MLYKDYRDMHLTEVSCILHVSTTYMFSVLLCCNVLPVIVIITFCLEKGATSFLALTLPDAAIFHNSFTEECSSVFLANLLRNML